VKLPGLALLSLLLPAPAAAHALDEYVQHSLITVEKNRIEIFMRLVPGVMVLPPVLDMIDRNGDRKISAGEARAYGALLQDDLRLVLDGRPLAAKLLSVQVPQPGDLKDGFGAISLTLAAAAPSAPGPHRLELTNRHQPKYSAYVVNSVQPGDKSVRIARQARNPNQSFYRLDYVLAR
jgi:hypothetical protein